MTCTHVQETIRTKLGNPACILKWSNSTTWNFEGLRDREVLRDRCVRAVGERRGRRKEAKSIGLTPYPLLCRPYRYGVQNRRQKPTHFLPIVSRRFDNHIRRKVYISPFFDMAMPTCFQSFYEIEINSSGFISKMKPLPFRATLCHESVMPGPMTCHSPKMKKVHFYIFTFLQRNTFLNVILDKEWNMKCIL